MLEDLRTVAPASRGFRLHDRQARIGHLELFIDEGSLFPLRTAGGLTLGFYLDGAGRYVYTSEDPADRVVIASNVTRETHAPIYRDFTVRDRFKRLVVLFAAPAFEDLLGGAGRADTAAAPVAAAGDLPEPELGGSTRSGFDRIWKRIGQAYLPYDHLVARARLNGGRLQHVYAELEGGAETAGYTWDRMGRFEERLGLFRKIQGVDLRFTRALSVQPIDGGLAAQSPLVRLTDLTVEVATEDNRNATINSELTLESQVDGLSLLHLDLINNRDPGHFNWDSNKNRLTLISVTDEAGRSLPFSHRYYEVLVRLPGPLARGGLKHLRFETRGEVLTDRHGRHDDNYFGLIFDAWYPQPAGRLAADFPSTLTVRTRLPFRPVASGRPIGYQEKGGSCELQTRSPASASGPVIFAGNYVTREEMAGNVLIRSNAYASELAESQENMPKIAGRFLQFYASILGPYPFGKLDIVEIPTPLQEVGDAFGCFGAGLGGVFGIAPAGIVLLSSDAYNPYRLRAQLNAYRDFINMYSRSPGSAGASSWQISRGVNARLAHEIAHQWFPHQATPATVRDAWLSESFAEYLSGLAMGALQADPENVEGFRQQFDRWHFEARGCADIGSLESATMVTGDGGRAYVCLVYNRGPLVLHMLRTLVGNDRFFAVLRDFLGRGRSGPVRTADFRSAVEAVLQVDMGWFFDQWIVQGGIPEIKLDYAVRQREDGTFILSGRAIQTEGAGFKKLHIPFVLDMGDGRTELRLLFQDQPAKEFGFELPGRPKKVSVDPARNNLAVYH